MIILIVLSIVVMYYFSAGFRGFLDSIFYEVGSFWEGHRAWFIWIAIALWLIPTAILLAIGWYANSMTSIVVFMVLFPVWILLSVGRGISRVRTIIPRVGTVVVSRSSRGLLRCIVSVALILAVANICIGLWSPEVKGSLNRWSENKNQEIANWFQKDSLKSEPEEGTFVKVIENGKVSVSSTKRISVNEGDILMAVNLKGQKANEVSEGVTKVMLKNEDGEFMGGQVGWIPTRKLDWDWQAKVEKTEPTVSEKTSRISIQESFVPDSVEDKIIASVDSGTYVFNVSGLYQKKWDDGKFSSIDASKGIFHSTLERPVPYPEKGYGVVYLLVAGKPVFPGEKFYVPSASGVLAGVNIPVSKERGNTENTGSVRIIIEPA